MECLNDELLAAYLDARCDEQTRAQIDGHLDRCPRCIGAVAEYVRIFGQIHASQGSHPPVDRSGRIFRRGSRFGRYTLLDVAGAGGTSIVYAAHDPKLCRRVALKVARPPADDSRAKARLLEEARAIARLSHRNVVVVHDVGEHAGYVYMAMELLEGRTLARAVAEGMPRGRIVATYRDAARALCAAHDEDLVHGDFKPDNVLVTDAQRVVVVDFGFARRSPHHEPASAASGGTPAFMAPELRRGAPPSTTTDVYAFAVSLWHGLTGRYPTGTADAAPEIPRPLRRSLRHALAPDPRHRPTTLRPLLRALDLQGSRRGWATVGLVGLTVAGMSLAWAFPPAPSCPTSQTAQTELWDTGMRSQLSSRISAQHNAALHDYATRWSEIRVSACVDTWERGRYTPAQLESINRCLDRNRARFSAVAQTLANSSGPQLARAGEAVDELFPNDPCEGEDTFHTGVAPPTEAQRESVAELRRELERAHTLRVIGPIPDALEATRSVISGAESLGYEPLLAHAQLELAASLNALPDPPAAEAAARRALALAEREGMTQTRFDAWVQQLYALGMQGHYDEALHLTKAAQASLDAFPDPRPQRARLTVFVGKLHAHRDAPQLACETLEDALAQLEALHGPDDPALLAALSPLADCAQALAQLDRAQQYAQRAVKLARAHFGEHDRRLAEPLSQLASLDLRRFEFESARTRSREVLAVLERAHGERSPTLYPVLDNAARAAIFAGHAEEALTLIDRGVGVASGGEPRSEVRSLRQAAYIRFEAAKLLSEDQAARRLDEAHDLLDRAEARVPGLDLPRFERARILNYRGAIYSGQRRWSDAVASITAALELFDPAQEDPTLDPMLMSRGYAYAQLGRYDEAEADYIAARDGALGRNDPRFRAVVQRNLGLAYLRAGRTHQAVATARVVAVAYETYPELATTAPLEELESLVDRG